MTKTYVLTSGTRREHLPDLHLPISDHPAIGEGRYPMPFLHAGDMRQARGPVRPAVCHRSRPCGQVCLRIDTDLPWLGVARGRAAGAGTPPTR